MLKGAAAALPAAGIFALPTLARAIEDNSTPQQRPKVKITDERMYGFIPIQVSMVRANRRMRRWALLR
jgi:hypothetical protein